MSKRIVLIAAIPILAITALLTSFALGMRFKLRPVQDAVRRMNRAFVNPRSMKTAGTPGSPNSVIRHVGRASRARYETPVGPVETEDGFVFPLPYGTNPDWLKNVLAAGSAELMYQGQIYRVDQPELVSSNVGNSYFPPDVQRTHRLFDVDDFLLMRRAESV